MISRERDNKFKHCFPSSPLLLILSCAIPKGETQTAPQKIKRNLIAGSILVLAILSSAFFAGRLDTQLVGARRLFSAASNEDRMKDFPGIILWAWERPEDLSFIDAREVGVAFLARTIHLREDKTIARPRLQPLRVAPATKLIAVARIESDRAAPPSLSTEQRAQVVHALVELARVYKIAAIQIDFDARASERSFYTQLLTDLRREIPSPIKLSITALASWCMGDNWMSGLPIDEAVPMLFRMGADHRNVTAQLETGTDFSAAAARHSLGIATDEPIAMLPAGRRVYVFNPRSWTEETARKTIEEVRKWQLRE